MSENTVPAPSKMVKIDGARVKRFREAKGLTQLYIATVVGVTTDTISRWENRRYPSIKEENALRLAEALEVTVEDILEKEEVAPEVEEASAAVASPQTKQPSRILPWLLLLAALLLLPFIWFRLQQPEPVTVFASRILPPHIPSGQPFPVIIKIETRQPGPFSLIVRENIPPGCELLASGPAITGKDRKSSGLKWISRTTGQMTTFVYLAKTAAESGTTLRFSGSVTLGKQKSSGTVISGPDTLPVADYHWADANRDNRIVDDEILEVYDTFSALDNINYDWDEIDAIWSGESYHWHSTRNKFVIQQ